MTLTKENPVKLNQFGRQKTYRMGSRETYYVLQIEGEGEVDLVPFDKNFSDWYQMLNAVRYLESEGYRQDRRMK